MHLGPLLERARGRLLATLPDGRIEDGVVRFDVDAAGERRVHAVGFVITATTPTRLEATLTREDGATAAPVEVKLDAGATYAGVVELDPSPELVRHVSVRLSSGSGELDLHDLFVIAYG
jgi:hypothetical protein